MSRLAGWTRCCSSGSPIEAGCRYQLCSLWGVRVSWAGSLCASVVKFVSNGPRRLRPVARLRRDGTGATRLAPLARTIFPTPEDVPHAAVANAQRCSVENGTESLMYLSKLQGESSPLSMKIVRKVAMFDDHVVAERPGGGPVERISVPLASLRFRRADSALPQPRVIGVFGDPAPCDDGGRRTARCVGPSRDERVESGDRAESPLAG